MNPAEFHLRPEFFSEKLKPLLQWDEFEAEGFRFDTGVAALSIRNSVGTLIILPFQGQQIWDARFDGRSLSMRSMFDAPRPTQDYLQTYGAFFIHCGATAMGVPGPEDRHPLHGELPNAPYERAALVAGEDATGRYLAVTGSYRHTVAFNHNYVALPEVRLYAGARLFSVSMRIRNLKNSPMELMYLAHANFRPIDGGRLVYSAPAVPGNVRVRPNVPAHVKTPPGYREFLAELSRSPERHHVLEPGLAFDPEVVFYIDYRSDTQGWAHSLQVHPDGSADYIRHRPRELPHGIRWISRTADQDAIGIVLPATAEPEGYHAEAAKGNLRLLEGGEEFHCRMEMGALTPVEAASVQARIHELLG